MRRFPALKDFVNIIIYSVKRRGVEEREKIWFTISQQIALSPWGSSSLTWTQESYSLIKIRFNYFLLFKLELVYITII
jgi:hypothetical protein